MSLTAAVVVTGASSGIGRELARIAAHESAFTLLVGRSQVALDDVAAELSSCGIRAAGLSVDLADPSAGEHIERELATRNFYCDVLVNSAGFGLFGRAAELDRLEQLKLLDVNARALTDLTLRFLPGMVRRGRGGVLNVGSLTSYAPGPNMAVYYASKAYVKSFSAALSAEVAGTGVTVTCLTPGVVRTAFFQRCSVGETRLFKIAPRGNVEQTAQAGWRAFKNGKRFVMPGLTNRLIAGLCRGVPDGMLLWLISRLQHPPHSPRPRPIKIEAHRESDH